MNGDDIRYEIGLWEAVLDTVQDPHDYARLASSLSHAMASSWEEPAHAAVDDLLPIYQHFGSDSPNELLNKAYR